MNGKTDETVTEFKTGGENTNTSSILVSEYTFDSFIVDDSNKLAHDLALAVAEKNNEQSSNPLYIHADSGLGKTHLLNAIRHTVEKNNPHHKVVYIRCNDFMDELVNAIKSGRIDGFREKYINVDYMLIDDFQLIAGKSATEYELFTIYSALIDSGKTVVIAADKFPCEINDLDNRLRSHFMHGVVADIQQPEEPLRKEIIKKKAQQLGVLLPEDVVSYIAVNITSNIRELEGVVKGVVARSSILDEDITIDSVKAHLSYIELINKSKKENKIPDNISVSVEINIKKLCENTGFISLDEDDYKNVLDGAQQVYIGTGHTAGKFKSEKAARFAITNPIMAMPFNEASKVMIIITIPLDADLEDVEAAANLISSEAHKDANIIFGAFFDEEMEDEIRIDIIATK